MEIMKYRQNGGSHRRKWEGRSRHLFKIFVAASHQTGLDTRSKAQRPIKVGIKGRGRSGTSRDSNPAGLYIGDKGCSSPTRRWPNRSWGPFGLESAIDFDHPSDTNARRPSQKAREVCFHPFKITSCLLSFSVEIIIK